ncbi:hypothetical protein HanRHA438_Chr09g0422371 [Helianthus annuus]|nr:hypothetical protein HanIR_Chr09g0442171 [Helianthus annuus]KAJ0890311.1 hypothetical protein HanRHA438_Chr09g0422371 [Helianthus annuus]
MYRERMILDLLVMIPNNNHHDFLLLHLSPPSSSIITGTFNLHHPNHYLFSPTFLITTNPNKNKHKKQTTIIIIKHEARTLLKMPYKKEETLTGFLTLQHL